MATTSSQHSRQHNNDTKYPDAAPSAPHLHRRVFIGPLPEKIISETETQAHKRHNTGVLLGTVQVSNTSPDDRTDVSQLIKDHAFHFFVRQGGKTEDWDDEQERNRTEELLCRWRESEWGSIWHRRHRQHHGQANGQVPSHWVGGSFEVGYLLGVNVLEEGPVDVSAQQTKPTSRFVNSDAGKSIASPVDEGSGRPMHVVTPQTQDLLESSNSKDNFSPAASDAGLIPPSSSTALKARSRSNLIPRLTSKTSAFHSDNSKQSSKRERGKQGCPIEEETPEPAPPAEVLARADTLTQDVGSVATSTPDTVQDGDVLRDRMLVRVSSTKTEDISPHFSESTNRVTRGLQYQDYAEYIVVWRKDIIEMYEDHKLSIREWALGHKHLAYIIPLKCPRTRLSLYSFVDMTFCITSCPLRIYRSSHKERKSTEEPGRTHIFIFKVKSRSRAYDWTWHLWRYLGGQIPRSIDIRNPRLATKVAVNVPPNVLSGHDSARMFSRQNVIALCMRTLEAVPGSTSVIEHERQKGKTVQLAWRSDTKVDWVWLDEDARGNRREWAVLCGLAFKNSPQAPALEIRVAEHYPSSLRLKDGTILFQPPAIEGYVERVRPSTQVKQVLYLATHNGNLFTLSPHQAQPPSPPGVALMLDNMEQYKQTITKVEIERGIYQIMHSNGVCDLRNVVAVRRAFQHIPQHRHDQKNDRLAEDSSWLDVWGKVNERSASDDEDEGGEDGLHKALDKPHLRMKRSFELLLNSGNVVRFEVHSRRVANEWVERLRALVVYWKQRHRIDAKDQIDLAQALHPRLTPQIRIYNEHDVPPEKPDLSAPYPALDTLFNWCIIDGCRPIVKEGKLYMRKGLRGQYKLVQLFLVNGHLIRFLIKPNSSLHKPMKKINLMDAYVCSGYLAALTLPKGQYKPNAPALARRYGDGLEAVDRDEDMLFVISYRKHAAMIPPRPTLSAAADDNHVNDPAPPSVPSLSDKQKLLVCRTRSKLERDAWCWAINVEIEKLTRKFKEREEKLRQTGGLRKFD